jgi:hypothetical protein
LRIGGRTQRRGEAAPEATGGARSRCSMAGDGHLGGGRVALRRTARPPSLPPASGERGRGSERRDGSGSRSVEKEKRKLLYIFLSVDSEEKPRTRQRNQREAAEAVSNEIHFDQSGTSNARSNGREDLERRGHWSYGGALRGF